MNRIHYRNVVLIRIAEIARRECRLGGYGLSDSDTRKVMQ